MAYREAIKRGEYPSVKTMADMGHSKCVAWKVQREMVSLGFWDENAVSARKSNETRNRYRNRISNSQPINHGARKAIREIFLEHIARGVYPSTADMRNLGQSGWISQAVRKELVAEGLWNESEAIRQNQIKSVASRRASSDVNGKAYKVRDEEAKPPVLLKPKREPSKVFIARMMAQVAGRHESYQERTEDPARPKASIKGRSIVIPPQRKPIKWEAPEMPVVSSAKMRGG